MTYWPGRFKLPAYTLPPLVHLVAGGGGGLEPHAKAYETPPCPDSPQLVDRMGIEPIS